MDLPTPWILKNILKITQYLVNVQHVFTFAVNNSIKYAVDNLNLKIWLKISMLSLTMGHGQFEGLVTVELPRPLGHRNKRGFGREKLQSPNEQK